MDITIEDQVSLKAAPKAKRRPLSKTTRFEIFKRDSFKCSYCGATADAVALHVDHIIPVSKGGTNDFMNLITSCIPCNAGKSDRQLDDKSVAVKARKQTEDQQQIAEQIEMMAKWRASLLRLKDDETENAVAHWNSLTPGLILNRTAYGKIKKLLKTYSYDDVATAMEKSADQYLQLNNKGCCTPESYEKALEYIGRIAKWERAYKEDPDLEEVFRVKAIANKNCPNYFRASDAVQIIKDARALGGDFKEMRQIAGSCRSWSSFQEGMQDYIDGLQGRRAAEETSVQAGDIELTGSRVHCTRCNSLIDLKHACLIIHYYERKQPDPDGWLFTGEPGLMCDGTGCSPGEQLRDVQWREDNTGPDGQVLKGKTGWFPSRWFLGQDGLNLTIDLLFNGKTYFAPKVAAFFLKKLQIPGFDEAWSLQESRAGTVKKNYASLTKDEIVTILTAQK